MMRGWVPLSSFLFKSVALMGSWVLIYEWWLLPDGSLDKLMGENIAAVTAGVLTHLGFEVLLTGKVVSQVGLAGVEVAEGCNGLLAAGLFLSFILTYPSRQPIRNQLIYSAAGLALLYVLNVFRISALVLIQIYRPEWFANIHDHTGSMLYNGVILILWILWVKGDDRFKSE